MRHPPLQAPLLWQVYLGFWIIGVAALVWPWPALCCALLLALADKRLWRVARLLAALCLCLAGLAAAHWQFALPGPWGKGGPAWLTAPADKAAERVCGRVLDVRGLPDQRLRLLLENVRPASDATATPLPGLTAWTWDEALFRPVPGQSICLSRRPLPMHGFANKGLPDWEIWWAAQNVRWRLWSRGGRGEPEATGQGTRGAQLRETLRQNFLAALLPPGTESRTQAQAGEKTNTAAPPLPQGKAILPALLFGDRQYLDQKTLDNFAAATLIHSLALSGQHLAVAGLLGLLCILAAARFYPSLYLRRPRLLLVTAASCPPALAYLWLGNAPASLLRAACMLFVLAFWLARGRARTTWDALCAALACLCLLTPLRVLDTGLQLSALCVAVIALSLPWLRRITPPPVHETENFWRKTGRNLLRIFLISLLIQTALLPLNLLLFGNAGFWFPLNVLWLPVVDLLVLPGAALGLLLAAVGLEEPARLTLNMAALPCQWLVDGLSKLDTLGLLQNPVLLRPHWTALPAFAALLAGLACMGGGDGAPIKARRYILAGLALLCVGPLLRMEDRLATDLRLDVLDVGQGLALSLRAPGHVRLLLDGGGSASSRFDPGKALVGPVLTYNDAPRLAGVLNSHPDLDHLGGLFHLLNNFQVAALFHNGREAAGTRAPTWRDLRQSMEGRSLAEGDVLRLGDPAHGLLLEVLHPPRARTEEREHAEGGEDAALWSGNEASLVLRLTRHGQGLALFTGDAERRTLRRLLASGRDLQARVLVAPHHGSNRSFLAAFYKAVQPELVLVACGFQNRYNYPGQGLRAWLDKNGIPLLHTGEAGQIRVSWPPNGPWRVATTRALPMPEAPVRIPREAAKLPHK